MSEPMNILIIDDSVDDRMLYCRVLHKSADVNYIISEADNGEAGLKMIDQEKPDCILLDYSLPGRNGVEVLKRIRSLYQHLPVVMLTGQGNETVAVTAMQEGAQNYIAKSSITPESLQRAIRVAIEYCSLQKRVNDQRTSLEIFTRALAHDLKEPVRTITSFLDLLHEEEATFTEKGKSYFNYIQKAARRMDTLIDTVYYYTRLDDPEQSIEKDNCDLERVLAEAKENLSILISERKARITSDKLPVVSANRTQVTQLIQNIIINAIRHSEADPHIHLSAQQIDNQWQISITDNGPGIPMEYKDKIFEPFKRMTLAREQGLGLGLAICRKIVELHGGNIWMESEKGKGATFTFTLSVASKEEKEVKKVSNSKLGTILLVEDNEADIELTRIMLIEEPKLKCNLLVARDGNDALAKLSEDSSQQIDLLLLDINMPGIDGFDLLRKMRELEAFKDIPVVMCTTSTYDKDIEKAKALGAAGYLTKPAELAKLKPMIDAAANIKLEKEGNGYNLVRYA